MTAASPEATPPMIFSWWRKRRRRKILSRPFPPAWREVIERRLLAWRRLDDEERTRLERLVAVFVAEKSWEGCGGLELTEEIRVVIAVQACLLILNLDHDYYQNVRSILVYPAAVVANRRGGYDPETGEHDTIPILGEAMLRGPVMLVWDAVRRDCCHPSKGHNVVYHEFAHKLDMLDGSIDGVPPIFGAERYREWAEVITENYEDLVQRQARGQKTLLSDYASTDIAEFFAVATELFFNRPGKLRQTRRELYETLAAFYQQDPARRVRRHYDQKRRI